MLAHGEALAAKGDPAEIPACAACHGKALTGMEPAIPGSSACTATTSPRRWAAKWAAEEPGDDSDCMAQIAKLLTPEDIAAVNAWLAAQPVAPDVRPSPAGSLKLPMECGGLVSDGGEKKDEAKKDEGKQKDEERKSKRQRTPEAKPKDGEKQ